MSNAEILDLTVNIVGTAFLCGLYTGFLFIFFVKGR